MFGDEKKAVWLLSLTANVWQILADTRAPDEQWQLLYVPADSGARFSSEVTSLSQNWF